MSTVASSKKGSEFVNDEVDEVEVYSATLVLFVGGAGPASSDIVRKPGEGEEGICGSCRDTRARVSLQHARQPRVDLLAEFVGHAGHMRWNLQDVARWRRGRTGTG